MVSLSNQSLDRLDFHLCHTPAYLPTSSTERTASQPHRLDSKTRACARADLHPSLPPPRPRQPTSHIPIPIRVCLPARPPRRGKESKQASKQKSPDPRLPADRRGGWPAVMPSRAPSDVVGDGDTVFGLRSTRPTSYAGDLGARSDGPSGHSMCLRSILHADITGTKTSKDKDNKRYDLVSSPILDRFFSNPMSCSALLCSIPRPRLVSR